MSFLPPPNHLSQTDLNASNKTPIYTAICIGFVLATGSVILRGLARRKAKAAFGWDDYTILFALILLYALDIGTVLTVAKFGLGRHFPAVISVIVPFQKVSIGTITLWLSTAAATKASLLLLYFRLFSPSRRFRLAVRIGAGIVFCQWFSLTCVTIFQCIPIAAFWNRAIKDARCTNLGHVSLATGILNLLTDVLILCLPIPMVWGLNTTKAQKVTLTGVFLLGLFVCAISLVRIGLIAALGNDDPTWRLVDVIAWTILENSIGIVSACLPTMRPLFRRFFRGASSAEDFRKKNGRPSSQRAARTHFNRLLGESSPEAAHEGGTRGGKDIWTSPDLEADNELLSMDKAMTRPVHSMNSTSRREGQTYPVRSTRSAGYGSSF